MKAAKYDPYLWLLLGGDYWHFGDYHSRKGGGEKKHYKERKGRTGRRSRMEVQVRQARDVYSGKRCVFPVIK